MAHWFDRIAQRHIDEAAATGKLSGLAGEGKPLDRARLRETAEDVLHRMMGSEGFVPEEFSLSRQLDAMRAALEQLDDPAERKALQRKIALTDLRRNVSMDARRSSFR